MSIYLSVFSKGPFVRFVSRQLLGSQESALYLRGSAVQGIELVTHPHRVGQRGDSQVETDLKISLNDKSVVYKNIANHKEVKKQLDSLVVD
jgi:hypothetical protein